MIKIETEPVWYWVEVFDYDCWCALGGGFASEDSARAELERLQVKHLDRRFRMTMRIKIYTDEVAK